MTNFRVGETHFAGTVQVENGDEFQMCSFAHCLIDCGSAKARFWCCTFHFCQVEFRYDPTDSESKLFFEFSDFLNSVQHGEPA